MAPTSARSSWCAIAPATISASMPSLAARTSAWIAPYSQSRRADRCDVDTSGIPIPKTKIGFKPAVDRTRVDPLRQAGIDVSSLPQGRETLEAGFSCGASISVNAGPSPGI